MYLPCCLVEDHWSVIAHNLALNEYRLYDSLFVADKDMVAEAKKIIKQYTAHYEVRPEEDSTYAVVPCLHQKRGSNDCGVHVGYNVMRLCQDLPIDPEQDMYDMRQYFRAAVLRLVGLDDGEEEEENV